jgi:hypothetical protein
VLSIKLQNTKLEDAARLQLPAEAASSNISWVICALCYALALSLSLNGSSLWTDEAFSAWLASHPSFQSFFHSLVTGDSSDLQVGLYYTWLFIWSRVFGTSELALRAANIPFIAIFSFALVFTSWKILKSRVAWLAAGMLPFVWHYAAEARAYMAVLAFAAAAVAALLGFIKNTASKYAWICLTCIFLGSLCHILFLLVLPPLAVTVLLAAKPYPRWRLWFKPMAAFFVPFAAFAVFLVWTFHRPAIDYAYPSPGVRQMVSVFYELAGFANFGPNRKFSLDFHPYIVWTALGALGILAGAGTAAVAGLRYRKDRLPVVLSVAALFAFVEVVAISFGLGKQFDARHLAAIVPFFLFLLMAAAARAGKTGNIALVLMGVTWLIADIRAAVLPEYWKEDYRAAVAIVETIHRQTGAAVAIVSDPVAPAYYGLDVRGPSPCYPFGRPCEDALSRVPWSSTKPSPEKITAFHALNWTSDHISSWLAAERAQGVPVAIMLQLDRGHQDPAWWPAIRSDRRSTSTKVHGFEIVLLQPAAP